MPCCWRFPAYHPVSAAAGAPAPLADAPAAPLSGSRKELAPGDISELVNSNWRFGSPLPMAAPCPQALLSGDARSFRWLALVAEPEVKAWQRTVPVQTGLTLLASSSQARTQLADNPLPAGGYEVIAEPQRHRWGLCPGDPRLLEGPVLPLSTPSIVREAARWRSAIALAAAKHRSRMIAEPAQRSLQLPAGGNPSAKPRPRAGCALSRTPAAGRRPARAVSPILLLHPDSHCGGSDGVDEFYSIPSAAFAATTPWRPLSYCALRNCSGTAGHRLSRRRVESTGNYLTVHQFDAHAWVGISMKEEHGGESTHGGSGAGAH